MTLAASTSNAVRCTPPGTAVSFGIHVPSSSLARSKAGWRLSVAKVSAQVRVMPEMASVVEGDVDAAAVDLTANGVAEVAVMMLLGLVTGAAGWGERKVFERVAARDLQKRVLAGLARHWAHVPGPLMQGFIPDDNGFLDTALDGGIWIGSVEVGSSGPWSVAISAQIQGDSSWQKPQGSGRFGAGAEGFEVEFARFWGRRLEKWAVKSISSISSVSLFSSPSSGS